MSGLRPTEMTIRDLLQEELRRRGVTVVPEFSVSTPVGRMMPDMLLKNGAPYVVETKLGAEAKLLDAMMKLYEYSKYVAEAKGAFAVLFPEELRRPWPHDVIMSIATNPKTEYVVTAIFKDLRPSQRFAGNLSEIADWMAGHVLRAPVVEADTGFAIRVLRDAVSYITVAVRQLRGKELEDIFGGKTVFENILQYEEGRYPLEEMRQAATYLLVNQLLFYHVLSRMDASFSAVDEEKIQRPSDLMQYFEPVLKRNYSSIFGFDVASRLPVDATEVVKKVVMVVKALAPEKIRHDLLGKVFHELIPPEIRKPVAAFYTNNQAAEILAQLSIDKPDAKVMDLAVGSGTLLVAAYHRKRELLQKIKGTIELQDHKKFLEQDLTGIDIMPFAAHLAVVHLSLQALLYETEKVRVAVWDSTELKPGQTIPPISSELKQAYRRPTLDMFAEHPPTRKEPYITKGPVTLQGVGGEEIPLEQVDVIIMNPPFTRYQRIPPMYKEKLRERFSERRYQRCIHGQLGLHGYFLLLADRFLSEGGRLAAVLPITTLSAKGLYEIQNLWFEEYSIEYVIACSGRSAFSEDVRTREILLVAKKEKTKNNNAAIIILKFSPDNITTEEARSLARTIKELRDTQKVGVTVDTEKYLFTFIPQSELQKSKRSLFRAISIYEKSLVDMNAEILSLLDKSGKACTFGEFLTKIHGDIHESPGGLVRYGYYGLVVLGNERKAIKKHDYWVVKESNQETLTAENRFSKVTFEIPRGSVIPNMRRPAGSTSIDVTNNFDYLIVEPFKDFESFLQNSVSGKEYKEALEQVKSRWWREFAEGHSSHCVFLRRGNITAPKTHCVAFFSETPVFSGAGGGLWTLDAGKEESMLFSIWFNSSLNLFQMLTERKETEGGWVWFDDYVLREFMMPDFSMLPREEKEKVIALFHKHGKTLLPSILTQLETKNYVRREIDMTFLRILGMPEYEIDKFLDNLYRVLVAEFKKLQRVMGSRRKS